MKETAWFYIGLTLLSALTFYVPRALGLHPAVAALLGVGVAVAYMASFQSVVRWTKLRTDNTDKEMDPQ